jgi:hypothetical protein
VTQAKGVVRKTHKMVIKTKFDLVYLSAPQRLKIGPRSMTELLAPRSTVLMSFWTLPIVRPLIVGGGGLKRCLKCALRSTVIASAHNQMVHKRFQTPLSVLPLTMGGGVWHDV